MGTFGLLTVDSNYQIKEPTSQFFASQLITLEWVQPGTGKHELFPTKSDIVDPAGHSLVTAYSVLRPDGQWAIMLINKDQENSHAVHISFEDEKTGTDNFLSGAVDVITFGSEQYQWRPCEAGGSADPDGPASKSTITAGRGTNYVIPMASLTVVRGRLATARTAKPLQ